MMLLSDIFYSDKLRGYAMVFLNIARRCFYRYAKSTVVISFLGLVLLCAVIPSFAQIQSNKTATASPSAALTNLSLTGSLASNTPASTGLALAQGSQSTQSANPYGLAAIWLQGDWVAKGCLLLLSIMSIASWVVLVTKTMALQLLKKQTTHAHSAFSDIRHFASHVAALSLDNPLRFVAESGSTAAKQYAAVKPRVDYDTWLIRAIEQSLSAIHTRMQDGMAVLATVGSTAPFVGLFGTVWAIYSALIKIGASGQSSIDRVAGPVGEALIMTAIGLAVAVPAVFGYNWLLRQNKLALESVRSFGGKLHGMLLATSDGSDVLKTTVERSQ